MAVQTRPRTIHQRGVGHVLVLLRSVPWWIAPLAVAAITMLMSLAFTPTWGFSLDDAWTHQAFARTWATTGQFALQKGNGPSGSTSPVWVVLLLPPYWLTHGHPSVDLVVGWTTMLGAIALGCLGIVSGVAAADLVAWRGRSSQHQVVAALVASLIVVTSWQAISFAFSGMETVLFALGALLLILLASRNVNPIRLGLVAASVIAVRPEAVILAAIVSFGAGWTALPARLGKRASITQRSPKSGLVNLLQLAWRADLAPWLRAWALPYFVVLALAMIPYLALNMAASGHPLPTTFYAKSSVSGGGNSIIARLTVIATYAGVLLAPSPGLLALWALTGINRILKRSPLQGNVSGLKLSLHATGNPEDVSAVARKGSRSTPLYKESFMTIETPRPQHELTAYPGKPSTSALLLMLWIWPVALVLAYSGNFTAIAYRYLVPALPPLLIIAAAGATAFLLSECWPIVARVALLALVVIMVISDVRGVQVYRDNVEATNDCWVANAVWIRDHVPSHALIATHDIGAIGYFGNHPLVDMAGLVSPEVIPLLNDENSIESYLKSRHVTYVMMWDDWFPPPARIAHDFAHRIAYSGCGGKFDLYVTDW